MQIDVIVKNKIAKRSDPNAFIVCGNSDYTIKFTFDEEWNEFTAKTARFYFNGNHEDVVFTGDECPVPVLSNIDGVFVGVFAGDLHTTTKAYIPCEKCILCLGGKVYAPTPDVYAQIMQMINDGMLKGEQGERGEKGEKGDAGAVKFVTVVSLPTENIQEDAIYLVPIADSEEENRYTEYVYIDGKWETIGAITVQVDHSEYVKFTDYANGTTAGVVYAPTGGWNGIKISDGIPQIIPATKGQIDAKTTPLFAIVPSNLDYAVKVGITTNKQTLTDEDQTNACDWLGALKAQNPEFTDGGATRGYVYFIDTDGNQTVRKAQIQAIENGTIPIRDPSYNFYVGEPRYAPHCANKGYVDGLIAELLARIEALENGG